MKDRIELVMEQFDFEKVAAIMVLLDWKWTQLKRVPTADELRETAKKLLGDAANGGGCSSTGGLCACCGGEECPELTLDFTAVSSAVYP